MEKIEFLSEFFKNGLLIYTAALIFAYIGLAIFSIYETRTYLQRNSFVDYSIISESPLAPTISVIAPAYNEGATIIQNVHSLLSLHYKKCEVIIVNDGSTDDSLQLLRKAFELEKIDFKINPQLKTQPHKAIYKSTNPKYAKLIVVDKENGGKSDALNLGINIASHKLIACVDVDCILEKDSLVRMVKPFLEETESRVIAVGGVLRIANSCEVKDGEIVKVNLPESFVPRIQTVEYLRAFLLGRMAWSRLNGLLLISGAFGLFDKDTVIACGGYDITTVGEDMELVVKMRIYMHQQKEKYKMVYIPEPLCWTEIPESLKILGIQRNRWTRGTAETLTRHKQLFLNPKYKLLGLLSYPYWLVFEWAAPIIEFVGFLNFLILAFLGYVYWKFFWGLLFLVYSFSIVYSLYAIVVEELTYHQYKNKWDLGKILVAIFIEPIFFHPYLVLAAIRGNFDLIVGKKSWGEMKRKGFHATRT
ncbi:MAG: glycosyltransferase family 2 protein [Bacteroidetes bacterium]|nr:glycosyltransferase family 2 protein [Bacteroidota bacterium]MBK9799988.1 glycosyltransferase family 2 protein [Bacteroidota bacterium]MBP6414053.1 glycosyltransferase family 2 protein [Bacteroidia bacterium]